MSVRARWALFALALAVGGGVGAIPAFIHKAPPPRNWLESLPEMTSPYIGGGRVVATAENGQQLLVGRHGEDLCYQLGARGAGGCRSTGDFVGRRPLGRRYITLLGRTRDGRGVGWWGLVGDDARVLRVLYADGSSRRLPVQRGFVVFGDRSNPPRSVTVLDVAGAPFGTVTRYDAADTECTPTRCMSVMEFQSG